MTNPLLPTDDFWSRQAHRQTACFEFTPLGIPAKISANQPELLAAAKLSAGRFSLAQAAPMTTPIRWAVPLPILIQLVVTNQTQPPIPVDLPERLHYAGLGEWITVSAGAWGHALANLQTRTAVAFLSPAMAAETRLVSRYIIDHYLLNFI
jgi:hypothetical protein